MATINQLNLPAIFASAQAIKRSQAEIGLLEQKRRTLETKADKDAKIQVLRGQVAGGDLGALKRLLELDPSGSGDVVKQAKETLIPGVISQAEAAKADPAQYQRLVETLGDVDPDDPAPPLGSPEAGPFLDRVIAEGTAFINEQPEASPDIVRLQNARDAAVAAGNTKRATEIQAIIDRKGTIVGRTPQDVGPSRNRQDEIRGNVQSLSRARQTLAKVRESIVDKRGRAGLVGTASRIIQEGVGIVRDFADIGIDVPGFIAETLPEVSNDINSGAADQGISGFFDSSIPENDVFENSLAYALARARKGSGRLNRDDLINARRDTKITGLTSSDAVLSRLQAIEQELAAAEDDFQSRLEAETNDTDVILEFNPSTGRLERVQ